MDIEFLHLWFFRVSVIKAHFKKNVLCLLYRTVHRMVLLIPFNKLYRGRAVSSFNDFTLHVIRDRSKCFSNTNARRRIKAKVAL